MKCDEASACLVGAGERNARLYQNRRAAGKKSMLRHTHLRPSAEPLYGLQGRAVQRKNKN